MRIIKDRQIVEDAWTRLAPEAELPESGDVLIDLKRWNDAEDLASRQGQVGLLLQPDDDVTTIKRVHSLPLIAVDFPKFTDGRGYSLARLLRDRVGYRGELRAVGNVLRDHAGFRAYGLLLQEVDVSVFHGNEIRGNRVGVRLQNSNANDFRHNRLTGNLAGTTMNSSSRDNTFTRNQFGYNLRQIELTGPVPSNAWSVDGVGNQWWGALPMDLTGDGISEWPHHEADVMADRRERFPVVQLLTGSLGLRALEWALTRVPLPGTRHITDPHPLIRARSNTAPQ